MREVNLERLRTHRISLSHGHFLVYQAYLDDLFDCFKKYAQKKLLDIGCGNKPFQQILDPLVEEYIGCDIVQSSENKVDILCDATDIPLPDASFDTVVSTQLIEHIADYQLMINEAYRILKPGVFFIISGPMFWPLHEEPHDYFRFTKYGFHHVLTNAGFTIAEERANGGKWALAGQAFIMALYPEINTLKSFKWKFFRVIYKLMGGIKTANQFFSALDKKYTDKTNTMNYVFVAKK